MMILQIKIHPESTVRFLPNYVIIIAYVDSLNFAGFLATEVTIATFYEFFCSVIQL